MKIAIIGAGSIGLYYGTKLALAGSDVRFLMRSGLELARREGVRVKSPDGDLHLAEPAVFGSTAEIGTVDLVIISLKVIDNPILKDLLPPLLGPKTAVLTLQNGLGNEDFLAEHFGAERVLGGLCFVCLTRDTPASVEHFGHGTLSLGEYVTRGVSPRLGDVADRFTEAGVETYAVEDLPLERWKKLVWNIPFNGLSVATGGKTVDRILAEPELFERCLRLMSETIAIADALGHPIPAEFADFQIERTRVMGAYQPSTLVDFLAGKPLEIEAIWGEPLERGRKAGVATPELERLVGELRERDGLGGN